MRGVCHVGVLHVRELAWQLKNGWLRHKKENRERAVAVHVDAASLLFLCRIAAVGAAASLNAKTHTKRKGVETQIRLCASAYGGEHGGFKETTL